MDFIEGEIENSESLISHSLWGLKNEALIQEFQYRKPSGTSSKQSLVQNSNMKEEKRYIITPSPFGVELFMWAYGHGQRRLDDFLSQSIEFSNTQNLSLKAFKSWPGPYIWVENIEELEKILRTGQNSK